jgi:hypothetical protein
VTISTETSAVTYAGNGATSTFPFTFPIFARTHLVVTHIAADGSESLMTENTNYTLTWVGPGETGTVNRIEVILGVPTPFPLPTGQSIRIERIVPLVQDKDLLNNSRIRMDQVEAGLDYQVQISQQLDREVTSANHASAHLPGGTGAIPWHIVHGYGLASARPAAGPTNYGFFYHSTDTGATERSNGLTWDSYVVQFVATVSLVDGGPIIAAAPANTIAPAVTGTTELGDTLTCSTGTWTGGPTGYTYQWQRDAGNISGETNNTYVIAVEDFSTTLRCIVTATNPVGSANATSNGTATLTISRNSVAASAAGTAVTPTAMQRDKRALYHTGIVRRGAFTVVGVTTTATEHSIPIPTLTTPQQPFIIDVDITIPAGGLDGLMFTHSGLTGAADFGIAVEFEE